MLTCSECVICMYRTPLLPHLTSSWSSVSHQPSLEHRALRRCSLVATGPCCTVDVPLFVSASLCRLCEIAQPEWGMCRHGSVREFTSHRAALDRWITDPSSDTQADSSEACSPWLLRGLLAGSSPFPTGGQLDNTAWMEEGLALPPSLFHRLHSCPVGSLSETSSVCVCVSLSWPLLWQGTRVRQVHSFQVGLFPCVKAPSQAVRKGAVDF